MPLLVAIQLFQNWDEVKLVFKLIIFSTNYSQFWRPQICPFLNHIHFPIEHALPYYNPRQQIRVEADDGLRVTRGHEPDFLLALPI